MNEDTMERKSEVAIINMIKILEDSIWFKNLLNLKELFKDKSEEQIKTLIKLQIVQMIEAGYNQGAIDAIKDIETTTEEEEDKE